MNPEDIKIAASKIADLERIAEMIANLEAGAPFAVMVGGSNLNVGGATEASGDLRAMIVGYLKQAAVGPEAELAQLGVTMPEEFDATLAQIEADAQPNGVPN